MLVHTYGSLIPVAPVLLFSIICRSRGRGEHYFTLPVTIWDLPFKDRSFLISFYSNSKSLNIWGIAPVMFAIWEIDRRFHVQTPNRWFLVEPHFMTPSYNFLPSVGRASLWKTSIFWGCSTLAYSTVVREIVEEDSVRLPKHESQLVWMHKIVREKFFGLTKSHCS